MQSFGEGLKIKSMLLFYNSIVIIIYGCYNVITIIIISVTF